MLTQYYTPTKVLFGEDAEMHAGEQLKAAGAKKVLVHYGSGSAVKSGLLGKVTDQLDKEGIPYVLLGGVKPNPRLSLVYEGVELSKKEGVDWILAVGGGSVIDSAKAIAYGACDAGDVWDFYSGKRKPEASLPIGVILTLSATGSEMSDSSVISNEDGGLKRGYNNDLCRPRFALLNPALTYSVSPYQTSCGTADIMMHTIERFFHAGKGMELTDNLAMALIRTVMENGSLSGLHLIGAPPPGHPGRRLLGAQDVGQALSPDHGIAGRPQVLQRESGQIPVYPIEPVEQNITPDTLVQPLGPLAAEQSLPNLGGGNLHQAGDCQGNHLGPVLLL